MRALLILAILAFAAAMTFATPASGVLAWVWIAIMNPHRETFGMLSGLRLNLYIAAFVIFMWAISSERKIPRGNPAFFALALFSIWTVITTMFALDYDYSFEYLDRYIKIFLMLTAVAAIMTTRARIHALVWVFVLSLGYWGAKGGGFAIMSGGASTVFGPPKSFIRDNNHLALALILIPPLALYLGKFSQDIRIRYMAYGIGGLSFLSIIASFSRGALLAVAIATLYYLLRTRNKIIAIVPVIFIGIAVTSFVPNTWVNRMSTIENYSDDKSFQGRLDAWKTSFKIANARPLTGGGFSSVQINEVYFTYNPDSRLDSAKAAHSIYFQVLGDHGYLGLALYLWALATGWLCAFRAQALAKDRTDLKWLGDLAFAIQVSLIGFFAGGALLSLAYYDGMLLLVIIAGQLFYIAKTTTSEGPAGKQVNKKLHAQQFKGTGIDAR